MVDREQDRPDKPGEPTPKAKEPDRPPIGDKPPREWRTSREEFERRVPAPRAVKAVPREPTPEWASPRPEPAAAAGFSAPPEPQVAPPPAPDDVPQRYGLDRLVVLVRDPYWVYAWWELTDGTLADAQRILGTTATLVLRVYDISAILWDGRNHHSHFDVGIDDLAGNWYVELGKPGASFVAEIGLRTPDGRFLAMLRSNVVTLPRDGVSNVVDEEWMIVGEDERVLFERAGGLGLGSAEMPRLLEQRLRAEMASGLSSRGAAPSPVPAPRPGA